MYAYNLIKFDTYYLTHNAAEGGNRYITEITGLEKFILLEQATTFVALDGTVHQQFLGLTGIPISISFETIDTTTFAAMIVSIKDSRLNDTDIELIITGNISTGTLAVRCTDIEYPTGAAISAGLKNVKFNFITA